MQRCRVNVQNSEEDPSYSPTINHPGKSMSVGTCLLWPQLRAEAKGSFSCSRQLLELPRPQLLLGPPCCSAPPVHDQLLGMWCAGSLALHLIATWSVSPKRVNSSAMVVWVFFPRAKQNTKACVERPVTDRYILSLVRVLGKKYWRGRLCSVSS